MKKFFIAIVALAAAVSCSNDDIISIDRQAIGFGNPFVENSVRADYSDGVQKLTKFNVYGTVTGTAGTVNIFAGVPVTGNVGAAEWSYEEQYAQYWIPKADYDFAAVVDATVASQDANKMPLTLTTVADATSNLEDMLYATATVDNATADPGVVSFNFSHLLSKVHFTVTSNATGGYHHNVTNITVANFESGTYTIDSKTWAGGENKDVVFANIENVESTDTNGVSNADLLLVPNAATFNVTFTVDLYKNGTKLGTETKTVAVDNDLVKGNSYNFTIACSVGNPIKFTVENDPTWTDQPDVTVQ